jgi:hypothetical protein
MATWHTVETARDEWPDAPTDYGDGGDDSLGSLLAVAKEAVIAYAPAVEEALTDIPDGYRLAQLMQARNVWNSTVVSANRGEFDSGQYGLTASYPLDWQVRQLIRPKQGRPRVG